MTRQAALHPTGTQLRCPTCGHTIEVAAPIITAICHDRHRATQMRPVETADSREKRSA
jgi:hypothetical protein